jgi:hypothetical protein
MKHKTVSMSKKRVSNSREKKLSGEYLVIDNKLLMYILFEKIRELNLEKSKLNEPIEKGTDFKSKAKGNGK